VKQILILIIALFLFTGTCWAQLIIKNSSEEVLMQVDGNANVTIGSAQQTGTLTSDNIIIHDGLTFIAGAAEGLVLRSGGSGGVASWGLENQRLSLNGNDLQISDGTGTLLNGVSLPTGSDNQNLSSQKIGEQVTVDIDRGNPTTFSIQDDDHDANNEKPLAGNATTISGSSNRNVDVNVDNKSIVIESDQLKALPLLRYPGTGPRSVLVLFDENGPIQVQFKDGVPNYYDCSGGDPAHGWNTASSADYQIVNWDDPFSSYDGNGVHLEKELLSQVGKHYRAISVRMGGWRCSMANSNSARMYAAQSSDAYLQEIAGQGVADDIDADGLVTLDNNGGVYVISQFQQRTDRDLRLILFTIYSYIGEQ
jgi:hypothetical protein